jgi:thymidine kinase
MGSISIIYGCMFAGKTSELIKRIKEAEAKTRGGSLVIKHSFDNRYAESDIVSHDGHSYPAHLYKNLMDIEEEKYKGVENIFIDEAQFFGDIMVFLDNMRKKYPHMKIIIAGLNLTYECKDFGSMNEVIKLAQHKTELTARCESCGGSAYFTHRKTEILKDDEKNKTIIIGNKNLYQPMCKICYNLAI